MLYVNNSHVVWRWVLQPSLTATLFQFQQFFRILTTILNGCWAVNQFHASVHGNGQYAAFAILHFRFWWHFLDVKPEQGLTVLWQSCVHIHDAYNLFLFGRHLKEWRLRHHINPIALVGVVNPDLATVGFLRIVRHFKGDILFPLFINETGPVQHKRAHGLTAEKQRKEDSQCCLTQITHNEPPELYSCWPSVLPWRNDTVFRLPYPR